MPFQKGNKYGGKRNPPGGRPTKEKVEEDRLATEKAKRIIEQASAKIANRFVKRALSNKADKILMHAIDKLVPPAKQTLVLESDGLLERAVRELRERKSGSDR